MQEVVGRSSAVAPGAPGPPHAGGSVVGRAARAARALGLRRGCVLRVRLRLGLRVVLAGIGRAGSAAVAAVVGRVEARALEMDGDRVEDPLDRRAAYLADG